MKLQRHALLAILVATSGCGIMPEERAISGAGIGAATGAVMGAVTTLAVGPGALIGALGGGLVGAMTNKDQVNMGDPLWKKSHAEAGPPAPVAELGQPETLTPAPDRHVVASIQDRLTYLGYEPGPVDGIYGRRTAAAIRRFQEEHGMDVDGLISTALVDRVLGTPKTGTFSI